MAIAEKNRQTKMIMKLMDNKTRCTYAIHPEASLESILNCAESINVFQAHEIRDVFRQVTVKLEAE